MPISLRSLTPGLGKLAQALAGGDQAFQAGQDDRLSFESKIAQQLAAMRQSDAAARHYDAQAAGETAKTDVLKGRQGLYKRQVALTAGTDVPMVEAFQQKVDTGFGPAVPMGPETEQGQYGTGSMQFEPQLAQGLTKAMQQWLPLLSNSGDLDPDKLAQARQIDQDTDLTNRLTAGGANPLTVALSKAAMKGELPYQANETGAVLNRYTGGLDTQNPMAGAAIDLRNQQAGAQKANAVQSYAAADASRASAGKYRAETGEVTAGRGAGKAPAGYRWLADGSLEPIPGGPADTSGKGAKLPAEVQRMNIALRSLDEGLNRYGEILTKFDPRNPKMQLDPTRRAEVESLVADLRLQLKEAAALGALTGPDVAILDQALANPTSLRGAVYGRGGLGTQLEEVRRSLQRRKNALAAEFNRPDMAGTPLPNGGGGTALPPGFDAPGRNAQSDFQRVVEGIRKGYNPDVVASNMAKAGYPPEVIRQVIQHARGQQ